MSSVFSAFSAICNRSAKLSAPSMRSRNPDMPECSFARAAKRLPSVVVSGLARADDSVFATSRPGDSVAQPDTRSIAARKSDGQSGVRK